MIDARNKLMVDKLCDQVARGCIENEWVEGFIWDTKLRVYAGMKLTTPQQVKLEDLFERY
jgi:hypothetical protein